MAKFLIAFNRTNKFEGGYVEDPADSGGETYMGISRHNFPTWDGWYSIDALKRYHPNAFRTLLAQTPELTEKVQVFYKTNFWDKIWGDKINNQNVANDLYDTGVNMGIGTSIKLSQKQFNLPQTAVMNIDLLNKLNSVV